MHLAIITEGSLVENSPSAMELPKEIEIVNIKPTAACIQNYDPCTCNTDSDGISINCVADSVIAIQEIFRRTTDPKIYRFYSSLKYSTNFLVPPDFLADKVVTNIDLSGNYRKNISIDPLAFRYTEKNTTSFTLEGFDISLLDFNFLRPFDYLTRLGIFGLYNLQSFQYLPPLPSLTILEITNCYNFSIETYFPNLTPAKLERLYLPENRLDDNGVKAIMESVASSSARSSLKEIILRTNELTTFPSLQSFTSLNYLDVDYNSITRILQSSLVFSSQMSYLSVVKNNITSIESGAFSRGK